MTFASSSAMITVDPATSATFDLDHVRGRVLGYFDGCLRDPGDPPGQYRIKPNGTKASLYASADVAIARAIMGEDLRATLPQAERRAWVRHIQSFARPDGRYADTFGHHQLHANGMVIGALGVLGGKQRYSVDPLYTPFQTIERMQAFLADQIDWVHQWTESHKFWGGLHMYAASGKADACWIEAVLSWLDSHVDPDTGWFGHPIKPADAQEALGGAAHIWPLYEHQGRPIPYPRRAIDQILAGQTESGSFFGHSIGGYMNLDALYGLKLMRQAAPGYRESDCNHAIIRHGRLLVRHLDTYFDQQPSAHSVLAVVGNFGLLQQLAPERFTDSQGRRWSDIFSDPRFYLAAAVEPDLACLTDTNKDALSCHTTAVAVSRSSSCWWSSASSRC